MSEVLIPQILTSTAERWINPAYLSGAGTERLRHAFNTVPSSLAVLPDFLRPDAAERVAACLESPGLGWRTSHWRRDEGRAMSRVAPEEWDGVAEGQRFSRHDVVPALAQAAAQPEQRALRNFLGFIAGPVFASWLSRVVGIELSDVPSCEVSRYQEGDFISEHDDLGDGRVVAVCFYLPSDRGAARGGELVLRNEAGQLAPAGPAFNSVSLIPIRAGCSHYVSPVTGAGATRQTVALAYRPR